MIKRLLNLRGLFSNTKFLVFFSVVLAFIFWMVVAIEYTPVVQTEVKDVPVSVNLEGSTADRLGLQCYGENDIKVNITIEGKRYDVGGNKVTAKDFIVEAETAYVDSAGEKALAVKVTPKNNDAEFEIVSLSADYINVFFDREVTKEVILEPQLNSTPEYVAAEGYVFYEDEIIAKRTVKLSGPKTQIDKINRAVLKLNVGSDLTKSTTVYGSVEFDALSSDETKYVTVDGKNLNEVSIAAEIPIYKIDILKTTVEFNNSSASEVFDYTVSPSNVKVAVLQNDDNIISEVVVGTIDLSQIPSKDYFEFSASKIDSSIKLLDNDIQTFKVSLKLPDNLVSESLSISERNIKIANTSGDGSYELDFDFDLDSITVCSANNDVSDINPRYIEGTIDLSDVKISGNGQRLPITFEILSDDDAWVAGTYYATVKPKN